MFAKQQVPSVGGACLFSSNSVAAGVLVSPGVYISPVMSGWVAMAPMMSVIRT